MEDRIGIDFSSSGSVMSKSQLEEQRRKRGQCLTCGQKTHQKKLFKMLPLTIHGSVLDGRCLKCKPLDVDNNDTVLPAVSRPATRQDLERFTRSQSSLQLNGPGMVPGGGISAASIPRRAHSNANVPVQRGLSGVSTASRESSSGTPRPRRIQEGTRSDEEDAGYRSSDGASRSSNRIRSGRVPGRASSSVDLREQDYNGGNNNRRTAGGRDQSLSSRESNYNQDYNDSPQAAPGAAAGLAQPMDQHQQQQQQQQFAATHGEVEDTTDPLRRAMIGGMAARRLAENFRERKRNESAAAAEPESAPTDIVINNHQSYDTPSLDRTNSLEGRGSLHSTETWKTEEEMNFDMPVHGVLNRGGQFVFEDTTKPLATGDGHAPAAAAAAPFGTMNAGSSRTMSSMSSVDEDDPGSGGRRQLSWKPAAEFSMKKTSTGIFEADHDDLSIDSETGSRRSKERMDGPNIPARTSSRADSRSGSHAGSHPPSRAGSRAGSREGGGSRDSSGAQQQMALSRLVAASDDYRVLLTIMQEFPSSGLVHQEGLKHLSNLHLTENEYNEAHAAGALKLVVVAMRRHPNNLELQSCGCRAIWNFSATARNQVALVEEGALDCILAAMNNFPSEVELQEKGLAALSNLGAAPQNQDSIIRKRIIEKIVEVMNRHSEDGPVQSKACSALTNFASYDSPLKLQIMDCGGGGAVVISMIMHPEDIDLQEKALRALRNICANSDENKVEVANVGGIDAVISAMQVHRDEPGVQEAGAWTLSNLAVNPDNKAVIGDSGGIDVVIRAMWVHSDNAGVQEWCCRALWTLSVDGRNRQIMMEVGGISAVVNAMQAHADASTVQEKGCGVLSNLAATDDQSKIRIVEEEALDAIIMAMVLHSDHKSVQDRACSVLKRLAIPPNVKPMQAANVGELVRQAARKFPDKCEDKARAILSQLP